MDPKNGTSQCISQVQSLKLEKVGQVENSEVKCTIVIQLKDGGGGISSKQGNGGGKM